MPCRDDIAPTGYGTDWEARRLAEEALRETSRINKNFQQTLDELEKVKQQSKFYKDRLDAVTAHLCFSMRFLKRKYPDAYSDVLLNPTLEEWWEEHQKMDAKREKDQN